MPLRATLANATRLAHARIERELALDERADLERYCAYLAAMARFVAGVSPALTDARLPALGLETHVLARREWLRRDLRFFGLAEDATRLPARAPESFGARVGCAYVLEGSMLGGRALYRSLAPRWSLTPERGGAFLHGHGERTGEMWRRFVASLDALALPEDDVAECIDGANRAFEAIAELFRDRFPPAAFASIAAQGNAP